MDIGRGYKSDVDNLMATELRLGLPGTDEHQKPTPMTPRGSKRTLVDAEMDRSSNSNGDESDGGECREETASVAKAPVVGWPPIRTFRKNSIRARKTGGKNPSLYVKVSMDGAPYLRKIDLSVYKGYTDLRQGLESKFRCFSIGSKFVITYEDKDGDWMLVGDVPWEMFTCSCKRLRIMRSSEARGLGSSP